MDQRLWPARRIAEHAYCPRLFYLMEVEGLHQHNAETLKGLAVHAKVDKPSLEKSAESGESTNRSLVLTSAALSLTATLDMAVVDGESAMPIEYRKGSPAKNRETGAAEPWLVDRVQLGLQAILLEEHGYSVRRLSAYYAETRSRLEFDFTETVRAEALETLAKARECAGGPRPLPLVNDQRCVGCSMQPVCLPDEVNHLLGLQERPRKVWPPRDEGIQVIAQTRALKIGVRGESLHITLDKRSDSGLEKTDIPIAAIDSLSVLGHVQVTTQAIHALCQAGVPVAFLSSLGRLVGFVEPMDPASARVKAAQVRAIDHPEKPLRLARKIIAAKIANQRTLLNRNHASPPRDAVDGLAACQLAAGIAMSLPELMGHEGQAAAIYFAHFGDMVKGECGPMFGKNGRMRRPPPDPVNSALSLAYSILVNECVGALRIAGLEPAMGCLHATLPGRPALALDLMEPFRPLVADSVVLTAFNKGELVPGHFLKTAAGCQLTDHGRRAFFNAYSRRMDSVVTHPEFGYRLSYRRMIILHARMIASWFLGEFPDPSFITTR